MNRPVTTLFMLLSVDGKISTGATDEMDMDRDHPAFHVKEENLHIIFQEKLSLAAALTVLKEQFALRPAFVRNGCSEVRTV